jgi:hypothetical protein
MRNAIKIKMTIQCSYKGCDKEHNSLIIVHGLDCRSSMNIHPQAYFDGVAWTNTGAYCIEHFENMVPSWLQINKGDE